MDRGYLQGQEMSITDQNNNINNDTLNILQEYNKYHELAAAAEYQMAAAMEIEEADEKGQTILMDYLQESSPEYSYSPLTTSSSQTTIDSNVRDVLKSIERVLSVGALDEVFLPMQPSFQPEEKRFDEASNSTTSSRSCYVNGNEPIFHISSPDPSASYQQPFSEF
ncbi:hypothetical protein CCACVL1_15736 [Corchorus capsularis]|uniref:Uncharacterized protein n=1 Tax=Corchorus capsularis TaxID=210143 RepID=A0A1R3I166_COCAP|nr:hypothetical protein CCACVL1_15736 [Corchorus capsularis]